MTRFSLSLRKTVNPGLVPYQQLPTSITPILPVFPLLIPVTLAANYVAPALGIAPRQWRQAQCPRIGEAEILGLISERGSPPQEWLELGSGVLGAWGTVRLASLAAAALSGAAVPPAALVVAGGAALAGVAGSLAASHLRTTALEAQAQKIQLQPGGDIEFVPIDTGICVYRFPDPAPAKLEVAEGGGKGGPILVPEWWAVRPGAERPQLTVTLVGQTENGRTFRGLTIPHYSGPRKLDQPPVPPHERGPVMGELTLADNSKIRVFCSSEAESRRVIGAVLNWVNPEFVPEEPQTKIEVKLLKKDGLYKQIRVEPLRAYLWPKGQRSAAGEPDAMPVLVWDARLNRSSG